MKKQKLGKVLVSGVVSVCLMTTGIALASENVDANFHESRIQVFENGVQTPYSMYFRQMA